MNRGKSVLLVAIVCASLSCTRRAVMYQDQMINVKSTAVYYVPDARSGGHLEAKLQVTNLTKYELRTAAAYTIVGYEHGQGGHYQGEKRWKRVESPAVLDVQIPSNGEKAFVVRWPYSPKKPEKATVKLQFVVAGSVPIVLYSDVLNIDRKDIGAQPIEYTGSGPVTQQNEVK